MTVFHSEPTQCYGASLTWRWCLGQQEKAEAKEENSHRQLLAGTTQELNC